MQPEKAIAGYLWDMLETAREVRSLTDGVGLEAYLANRLLLLSVERLIERIGEFASRVPDDYRISHPEVDWREIVGQRNILAHDYGSIEPQKVWEAALFDIPTLIAALEPLLPPLDEWKQSL